MAIGRAFQCKTHSQHKRQPNIIQSLPNIKPRQTTPHCRQNFQICRYAPPALIAKAFTKTLTPANSVDEIAAGAYRQPGAAD